MDEFSSSAYQASCDIQERMYQFWANVDGVTDEIMLFDKNDRLPSALNPRRAKEVILGGPMTPELFPWHFEESWGQVRDYMLHNTVDWDGPEVSKATSIIDKLDRAEKYKVRMALLEADLPEKVRYHLSELGEWLSSYINDKIYRRVARGANSWGALTSFVGRALKTRRLLSAQGDFWYTAQSMWRNSNYVDCRSPDMGVSWSISYTVFVIFGIVADCWAFATAPSGYWPYLLAALTVPLVISRAALQWLRQPIAVSLMVGGAFGALVLRAFLVGPGGPGFRQLILVAAVSVLLGFYLIYHRGAYMRVLRNADRYGPFACVWMRPAPGTTIKKWRTPKHVEFVLTDTNSNIVWRRIAPMRFAEQFTYEYPSSGVQKNLGIEGEGNWRKVFPALLCPRETTRDWKRWWSGGPSRIKWQNPNSFQRPDVDPITDKRWYKMLWHDTLLYRPCLLSDAMTLGIPGLSPASAKEFIFSHGLDTEPPGYAEAVALKTIPANASY